MTAQEDLTGMPTPGPWSAFKGISETDEMRCGVTVARGKVEYLLATIENGAPGDFCETEYANACLMAAAPDLYEAVRRWLTWCDDWHAGKPHPIDDLEFARAALLKARTALAGVTDPATRSFNEHMVEELIVAAYKRGFHFNNDNEGDDTYLTKAAHDYADKTMNAPSAGVTAPSEVDAK